MATPRRFRFSALLPFLLVVALVLVPWTRGLLVRAWSVVVHPVERGISGWQSRWAWPWDVSRINRQLHDAQAQNAQLLKQVTDAQSQLDAATASDRLRTLLTPLKHTTVFASVIGYSPDPGVQSVTIDRGSSDGVLLGMAVVSDAGVVVGKIVSVSDATSSILLLSDSQSSMLARINSSARSPGVVKGDQGVSVRMELIPKNDTVSIGDTVVTSGSEERIPPDLPIGTIQDVSTRPGDVFQNAKVQSPQSGTHLSVVAVIIR